MHNNILLSDLQIIKKVFFSSVWSLVIFDPQAKLVSNYSVEGVKVFSSLKSLMEDVSPISTSFVLVNFSTQAFDELSNHPWMEARIDLCKRADANGFHYINNTDQSMRWFFPADSKSSCFLELYNSSGWKALVYKTLVRFAHRLKSMQLLSDGQFWIWTKKTTKLESVAKTIDYDDFAVFTGTVGGNRKAIIALASEKKCHYFLKLPLTKAAKDLVENEYFQLSAISNENFNHLVVPKVIALEEKIALKNIRPSSYLSNTKIQKLHLLALEELYSTSFHRQQLDATSFWVKITSARFYFQRPAQSNNNDFLQRYQRIRNLCMQRLEEIDTSRIVSLGMGHGDFTPWNMYLSSTKLHLYDWEMSWRDMPLFFDIFHFIFQKNILIDRKGLATIKQEIEQVLNLAASKKMLQHYSIDWELHLQYYLLFIVCYYLPKYDQQAPLHQQVFWLMDIWEEALEDYFPALAYKELKL